MSITNASTIAEADLDGMATTAVQAIQADNAQLPGGLEVSFVFPGATAALYGTNPERFKGVWPVPCDCYVETVTVEGGDLTNPTTVTVDVTATGAAGNVAATVTDPLSLWPIQVSGAIPGTGALSRLLLDNTKSSPKSFAATSPGHRTLLRGSWIKVNVNPGANAVAASMIRVVLVLREFLARE
jgi:hypothetical protein